MENSGRRNGGTRENEDLENWSSCGEPRGGVMEGPERTWIWRRGVRREFRHEVSSAAVWSLASCLWSFVWLRVVIENSGTFPDFGCLERLDRFLSHAIHR